MPYSDWKDPVLGDLVVIAKHDDRRNAIIEKGKRLKRKLEKATGQRDDAAKALEDHEEAQKLLRKKEVKLQNDIRSFENKRAAAQRALDAGMGSVDAAERQVEICSGRIDELETDQLELMEQQEEGVARRATLTEAKEAAHTHWEAVYADLEPQLTDLRAQLAQVTRDRKPLVEALPREERAAYLQLIKLKGTALSVVKDRACSACSHMLPLSHLTDVKEGRRIVCAGCARWLYRPS